MQICVIFFSIVVTCASSTSIASKVISQSIANIYMNIFFKEQRPREIRIEELTNRKRAVKKKQINILKIPCPLSRKNN